MNADTRHQAMIARALYGGPAHLPDGLLAGSRRRIELGLAVHANTLAHARMTAMADSCTRLIAHIGRPAFDALAAAFIAQPDTIGRPLIRIAEGFATWLEAQGEPADIIVQARIDEAALAALHAPDRSVLGLADLPQDITTLMALRVIRHPAAFVVASGDGGAVLITRPQLAVLEQVIDANAVAIMRRLEVGPVPVGELLALIETDPASPLITLLAAGALSAAGGHEEAE